MEKVIHMLEVNELWQKEMYVPEEIFYSMPEDMQIMLGGKEYTVQTMTESIVQKREY